MPLFFLLNMILRNGQDARNVGRPVRGLQRAVSVASALVAARRQGHRHSTWSHEEEEEEEDVGTPVGIWLLGREGRTGHPRVSLHPQCLAVTPCHSCCWGFPPHFLRTREVH